MAIVEDNVYCRYSYKYLLKFLQVEGRYDSEGVDYANYLLSMGDAKSIDEMMDIYNIVFKKIAYYVFSRTLPEYWFITDSWDRYKYLAEELNTCFNENLLKWYKSLQSPKEEDCILCIVNLRNCDTKTRIQNEIILHKQFEKLHGLLEIIAKRDNSYSIRSQIRKLIPRTEDYSEMKSQYADIMDDLLGFGYKYSIEETKFEEIRGINIKKEIQLRFENKKNIEKREKGEKVIKIVLTILFMVLCFGLILLVSNIGLIGIIIIIGFLGALPKILLTGKL